MMWPDLEDRRRTHPDDAHEPSCCGGCDVCFAVCGGYHGPERRKHWPVAVEVTSGSVTLPATDTER
jgi:hypothetical protein